MIYHAILLCPGFHVGVEESCALLGTNSLEGSSWKCGKSLRAFCSASEFSNFAILHFTLCAIQLFQPRHVKGSYATQNGDDLH